MAASTRARVCDATSALPLTTFDAVATDTPAAWATSSSVVRVLFAGIDEESFIESNFHTAIQQFSIITISKDFVFKEKEHKCFIMLSYDNLICKPLIADISTFMAKNDAMTAFDVILTTS